MWGDRASGDAESGDTDARETDVLLPQAGSSIVSIFYPRNTSLAADMILVDAETERHPLYVIMFGVSRHQNRSLM